MSTTVENQNPFALAGREQNNNRSMVETATTRAAQEVQAAMVIAKKFPRDQMRAFERIMQACARPALADEATYEYPRGIDPETGKKNFVTGPSIRLAECLAQNWGNLQFGITELEQKDGESIIEAFAWDLETNTRQTKVFTVKHERHKKGGRVDRLTDPRDIYEMVANQGARRLRACILGVMPGDLIDAALVECDRTLAKQNKEPLIDRVRKMIPAFGELGVSQAMIEKKLRNKLDEMTEAEFRDLRKIYVSIRDGVGKREDYFEPVAQAPEGIQPQPTAPADEVPMNFPPASSAPLPAETKREPKKSKAPSPLETIRGLLETDEVGEGEVLEIAVRKGWVEPASNLNLGGLTLEKLNLLIENWDFIATQIRIDRRGAQ